MGYFSLSARVPEASALDTRILAGLYELFSQMPFMRKVHRRFVAGALAFGIERGNGLDLGTGPGFAAVEIARRRSGLRMVGLDLAAHMVERAWQQAARGELDGRGLWPQGDGHHLPFADGSFDLVVSSFALHHWDDPIRIMNEIARVLAPGGCYYITDVCREASLFQRVFAYGSIPFASLPFGSYWGYGGYYESVRAGYTRREARVLLERSMLPPGQVGRASTWFVPMLTIASKVPD